MSDFNVRAGLHRVEMGDLKRGTTIKNSPRYLETLTVAQCINKVMSKRQADRVIYSITVPFEAGFGKDVLEYKDIEEIYQRPDFPRRAA